MREGGDLPWVRGNAGTDERRGQENKLEHKKHFEALLPPGPAMPEACVRTRAARIDATERPVKSFMFAAQTIVEGVQVE